MSFNLIDAFKNLLTFQETDATLERLNDIAVIDIKLAQSNYFRDFNSVEEIPITGNEFVLGASHLAGTAYETTGPIRGDFIVSPIYGTVNIEEVRPMVILGNLVAYRIRSNK